MKRRLKSCVEEWPECAEGEYNPKCCRFPKSCSCTVYDEQYVSEVDLEPQQESTLATFAAPPTSGTWGIGQKWTDPEGITWVCTVGGEPGTWTMLAEDRVCSRTYPHPGHVYWKYGGKAKFYCPGNFTTTGEEMRMTEQSPLSKDQAARAEALVEAKRVLTIGGSKEPDAMDIHSLAVYIMTGQDPWNRSTPNHMTEQVVTMGGEVVATFTRCDDPACGAEHEQ